ncbi:MAG: flagellar M-ring protein FliF [Sinobacterium sp.]|nr:flagellar M-ring protein FliF [Sinobacterium sp.]
MATENESGTVKKSEVGLFAQISDTLKKIPGLPQIIILSAIALSIALGIAIALWAHNPEYKVLYMGLDTLAQAQIVEVLEKQQTPYKINHLTGDISVPQTQYHTVKMKLAGEGVKPGLRGLESLSEDQAIGVSHFIEGKRYHHSLEVELGRTISSLQSVSKAKVHFAVPKTSSFVRQQANASASVLLHVLSGRNISYRQVSAIQELVASSISGLDVEQVSVVDQRGNLLSNDDDILSQSDRYLEHQSQLEKKYIQRIQRLLAPIVGYENISAQVSIDMDFSHHEQTKELYDPESQSVRSERSHSKTGSGNANVGGIPGSVSNQPAAKTANTGVQLATSSVSGAGSSQVHRNYELNKTLTYQQKGGGEIMRISAAVIINVPLMNGDAADTGTADKTGGGLPQEEQAKPVMTNEAISNLVKSAIGFTEQRGDSVTVMSANFIPEIEAEEHKVSFLDDLLASDMFYKVLRYVISAILLLLLIFKVIKPTIISMIEHFQERKSAELSESTSKTNDSSDAPVLSYEDKLDVVRKRISSDPMMTAQVMKSWMGDKHGAK